MCPGDIHPVEIALTRCYPSSQPTRTMGFATSQQKLALGLPKISPGDQQPLKALLTRCPEVIAATGCYDGFPAVR